MLLEAYPIKHAIVAKMEWRNTSGLIAPMGRYVIEKRIYIKALDRGMFHFM